MRAARLVITLVASGLALFFAILQLNVSVIDFFNTTKPEWIQKLALIAYYFCWLFGTRADTNTQEEIYVELPSTWHVTVGTFLMVAGFVLVAAFLLWAAGNEKRFAIALTSFFLFNIGFWVYLNHLLKPVMKTSQAKLARERAFFDLEKLRIAMEYLAGNWQWRRFALMGGVILAADIVCFVPSVRTGLSDVIQKLAGGLNEGTVYALLPDLFLLLFVSVSEIWIWIRRVRVATSLDVLEEMKQRYSIIR